MRFIAAFLIYVLSQLTYAYSNEYGHNHLMLLGHELLKQCGYSSIAHQYSVNDINTVVNGSTSVDYSVSPFSRYNRLFDWHFYKADQDSSTGLKKSRALFADRTFVDPWESLHNDYPNELNRTERLLLLGGYAHFIEDMANPAHVIPVFHMIGIKDGIDDFPSKYYQKPLNTVKFDDDICARFHEFDERVAKTKDKPNMKGKTNIIDTILHQAVRTTNQELTRVIPHCPSLTWNAFYTVSSSDEFWGGFYQQPLKTIKRYKNKRRANHTFKEKVVIGHEGVIHFSSNMECAFVKSSYQPFVDRLFENAIIYDAALLKHQVHRFAEES